MELSRAARDARADVGAGPGSRRVTVDGVSLAFDDEGSGAPLVCLHAIGHGARDFERLRARLRGRRRVLALDWPGHGRSAPDVRPPSATRYAELLAGFLDAVEVRQAVLVGNSIGGAAALRYAHAHPERVQALVLENPGGLAPTDDRLARAVLDAMARFFGAGARGARWFRPAFAAYYRLCVLPRRDAAAQRRRIVAGAYAAAPLLRDAWRGFARPQEDLRALVPAVACPVLFVWATWDRFVALGRSLPAIRRFADARLERAACGHAAHLERPAVFEAALERFLAELDARVTTTAAPPADVVGGPRDTGAAGRVGGL